MNVNFGKKEDKWICNHCGVKNTGKCIIPYIFDGTLLYICENCMDEWDKRINVMEHNYVEECYYI